VGTNSQNSLKTEEVAPASHAKRTHFCARKTQNELVFVHEKRKTTRTKWTSGGWCIRPEIRDVCAPDPSQSRNVTPTCRNTARRRHPCRPRKTVKIVGTNSQKSLKINEVAGTNCAKRTHFCARKTQNELIFAHEKCKTKRREERFVSMQSVLTKCLW